MLKENEIPYVFHDLSYCFNNRRYEVYVILIYENQKLLFRVINNHENCCHDGKLLMFNDMRKEKEVIAYDVTVSKVFEVISADYYEKMILVLENEIDELEKKRKKQELKRFNYISNKINELYEND